jgi:DNA (cytosine-5)-methyltransferase 1
LVTIEADERARAMKSKNMAALRRGYYRTMDLFSGCGGMTLGFDRAGFRCVSAVEVDDEARRSHELNFQNRVPGNQYKAYKDITNTEPEDAVAHLSNLTVENSVDVITGGFPCQAFSRLGRAALWRLAKQKNAHFNDPRATMYEYFIKYVARLQPLAFVIENVKEIGSFNHKNVAHELSVTMEELGYTTRYTILNAVWYGVPQLRERMIIVGIHKALGYEPRFPHIRHDYKLPVGYSTSRAGKNHFHVLPPFEYYVDHYELAKTLLPAVTAGEAFVDLPAIIHHLDGRKGKGHPRKTDEFLEYKKSVDNPFIREMKNWEGFESNGRSCGHIIRYTPRDYETFRRMPHGGMYPEALQTAEEIFAERLQVKEKEIGHRIRKGSKLWEELHKQTVPPYKVHRYPNKFRKMWADHPARTVPAHLGKDSYSHIHFDSEQARCISLREAARLQSFPDAFQFAGGMNSQLKQIGNAVPPLLAFAVASTLKETLAGIAQAEHTATTSRSRPVQQSLRL